VVQLNTPKALANVSPGLELATTLGSIRDTSKTPKGFVLKANPFRVRTPLDVMVPKVLASSNLGLKLANAFGVFKSNQVSNN